MKYFCFSNKEGSQITPFNNRGICKNIYFWEKHLPSIQHLIIGGLTISNYISELRIGAVL